MSGQDSAGDSTNNGILKSSEEAYIVGAFEVLDALLKHGNYHSQTIRVFDRHSQSMERHVRAMEKAGQTPEGLLKKLVPDLNRDEHSEETANGNSKIIVEVPRNGFIPVRDLVSNMGVPIKHRANAVKLVRELIDNNDPAVKLHSIKVTGGYQISHEQSVIDYVKPKLEEGGLFQRLRKRNISIPAAFANKPELPAINADGFISLTELMQEMHVPIKKRREALRYLTNVLDVGDPLLKGSYIARGKGYSINPSADVKKFLESKLTSEGSFQNEPVIRSKSMGTAIGLYDSPGSKMDRRASEVQLTLKATHKASDDSYDFNIRGIPVRLSAAALESVPRNSGVGALGYNPITARDRFKNLLLEAAKSSAYTGKGHELLTYKEDSGPIVDFRIAHGTVTEISLRKKL